MTHNDIRHKLSEYIDGSVTPDERTAIDEHLTTCTECSDALRELRKVIEAVKQIEEVDAPAWMTRKIMAKVRDEQEARKGLWRRARAFFTMRYPIQALTVLFMAVTAYYLYSSINPAQKYAGEPVGMLARKEAPAVGRIQEEGKALREAAPESKQAPQKPGYRSLDMKYSYEKPAAPVPAEAPAASAPASAKREAFMSAKDEADLEKRASAPRAAAPSLLMEQTAPSAGAAPHRDAKGETPPEPLKSGAARAEDKEADAQLAVTEHFAKNDLPGHMKVKGLSFSVRKYPPDQTDLQWLPKTAAYRSQPCSDRYIVDVELSGKSSKYLYCYERSQVVLLGVFELRNEVWSERK